MVVGCCSATQQHQGSNQALFVAQLSSGAHAVQYALAPGAYACDQTDGGSLRGCQAVSQPLRLPTVCLNTHFHCDQQAEKPMFNCSLSACCCCGVVRPRNNGWDWMAECTGDCVATLAAA